MNITFDDPRLTAYALGELAETDRRAIETEIQTSHECRCEVEEITHAAARIHAALASEPVAALTSIQQRAIEAKFTRATSKLRITWLSSVPSERSVRWPLKTALIAAVVLLILEFSFPTFMAFGLPSPFQHISAYATYAMFKMAGITVIKNGLHFTLPNVMPTDAHASPGLDFVVAPACYQIGSTLILLLASWLVGSLFLRSPWKRLLLTLFVVPLVIIKDAIRIFTLAELCVHLNSRSVLDSPFHHHGGPIFFALSLIPFLFFLVWLRKLESKS